jgi:hypothetical protein
MAHAFAGELNVSPWEALLTVVKRAAAKCEWYQRQLAELPAGLDPSELLPGGEHFALVREAERADTVLARFAKQAVDAGVAKMLAERVQLEVDAMVRVLEAGLRAVELTREQEDRARDAMAVELRALDRARDALGAAPTAAR